MDVLYIFTITILLTGASGTGFLIEDENTNEDQQQRILLRKLQNFQETKPVTWNEILADVLVNKIKIFSFTRQDKENTTKNEAPVSNEKTILTNFFSKVLYVYKKFVYDTYFWKRKASEDESVHLATIEPKNVEVIPKKIPEDVIKPTDVTFAEGPKSEVELIEPKYHGKITVENNTQIPNVPDSGQAENNYTKVIDVLDTDSDNGKPNVIASTQANVNSVTEETTVNCEEGFIKSEGGDCVQSVSRLILSVPHQCPSGYRKDWLGNCRKMFNF